jgi:3-methyladenine DNA glycosylase AlkD
MKNYIEIENFLNENSSEKLALFNAKLIFTKYKMYGIKIPVLRKASKDFYDKGVRFVDIQPNSFEEVVLKGLLLSYEKDIDLILESLESLLSYFDNWASVDVIVPSLKNSKTKNKHLLFSKNFAKVMKSLCVELA